MGIMDKGDDLRAERDDLRARVAQLETDNAALAVVKESLTAERDEARRAALNAALGEDWVPVGVLLPDQSTAVLGWDGHMVHMVTLESDGRHWIDDGSASDTNVTHWRELPAPPVMP